MMMKVGEGRTSNCAFIVFVKFALDEAKHEIGLAHSSLTQQNKLELEYLVHLFLPLPLRSRCLFVFCFVFTGTIKKGRLKFQGPRNTRDLNYMGKSTRTTGSSL
jgi:hypothetical protein